MDTCPTSFCNENGHMPKSPSPKRTYDERKRQQMWKGGGPKVQKMALTTGEIKGGHATKVATWHGE